MLSRVAERLYWFGRYLERAESTARLLSVYTNLVLDMPNVQFLWPALVQITGYEDAFHKRFKHANERNVVQFLLDDPRCSLRFCVNQARENVRTSRDLMPNEAWEKMNELHLLLQQNDLGRISRDNRFNLLSNVIDLCLELTGYLSGSLSRQPPHYFLKIGRSIERADMTTRVIDVGCLNLMERAPQRGQAEDNILWMGVLTSLNAYQMYRQAVQERVRDSLVTDFLLRDPSFPRSVMHSIASLRESFEKLPRHTDPKREADTMMKKLSALDVQSVLEQDGLHEWIDEFQSDMNHIHTAITDTWFLR